MYMFKNKLFLAVLSLVFATAIKAQTVVVDNAKFDPGVGNSYSAGGSVAVPLNNSGCFHYDVNPALTNKFKWELMDATGTNYVNSTGGVAATAAARVGDSVSAFYATFINAFLPATLPTGIYIIKVSATTLGATSANTIPFAVTNGTAITAAATPSDTLKMLKPEYYYGICDGLPVDSFSLLNNSTGSTTTLQVHDDYRNVTWSTLTPTGGKFLLQFTPTKVGTRYRDSYYTGIIKTVSGSVISTKAYHIINSSWDISAQVSAKSSSQQYSCSGDTIQLYIQIKPGNDQQIQQNFPGATVTVEWNSGGTSNPTDVLTQCQIIAANGYISHYYKDGACLAAGNTSYKTKATVNNPFNIINGPGLTGTCAAGAVDNSQAFVFSKPKAAFSCDSVVCLGDTIKFKNLSNPGQGPASQSGLTVCANLGRYRWDVFNTLPNGNPLYVSKNSETPKDTAYKFTLPTDAGYHQVKLTIDNNYNAQAPCPSHDTSRIICVDTATIFPLYRLDSAGLGTNIKNDSIIGCAPTIKLLNDTRRTFCLDSTQFNYIWQVYDATKPYVVKDSLKLSSGNFSWKVGGPRSMSPTISIEKTGKYWISLRVKGKCDTTQAVLKYVEANGDAGVNMEYDSVFNCGSPTSFIINYDSLATNTNLYANIGGVSTAITKNRVKYTYQASAAGSLKYRWTVKPGTSPTDWEFVGGTDTSSAFPQIQFKTKGIYSVSDTFKNSCATKVATQIVNYQAPPVALPSVSTVDTICHSVQSFKLYGFKIDTTKNKDVKITFSCVEDPNGTFVFDAGYNGDLTTTGYDTVHNLTPTYFPSSNAFTASCAAGKIFTIQMRVASKTNKVCTPVFEFRYLYILPCILSNDVSINVCSGTRLNYSITSPANTQFKYDISSPVTCGGTGAGSGGAYVSVLTDSLYLKPPGSTNTQVATYLITPKSGKCDGDPYKLTVNVQPIPAKPIVTMTYPNNAPDYSMCSGEQVLIDLQTPNSSDKFVWKSRRSLSYVTGYSQQVTPKAGPINDLLLNSQVTDTVTYTITTVSAFACKGDSSFAKVIVTPGVPKAKIIGSGGSRVYFCDSNCVVFRGNSPGLNGTGTWSLKSTSSTQTPTFTVIDDSTVRVCNIERKQDYWIEYLITPKLAGCRSWKDSINFYVYDTVSNIFGMRDTVFCDVKGTVNRNFIMCAQLSRPTPSGEIYFWTVKSGPGIKTTATGQTSGPCTQITFKDPEIDTVIVESYNGGCPSKFDTAIVRLYKPPVGNNSITLNPSMPNDRYCQNSNVDVSATLNAKEDDMYYWYYEDYPSYSNRINLMTNVNPVTINSLQDSIVVTGVVKSKGWNYGCFDTAVTAHKIIYVDSPSLRGVLSSKDTIVCRPGDRALITLSGHRGEEITWIASTTGCNTGYGPLSGIPFGSTSITPSIPSTIWYKAIVRNGNCSPDTTECIRIYIPVNSDKAVIYNNDTAICGGSTITLTGNTPVAGVGYWSAINGYNNTTGSGVNFYPASFETTINPVVANISTYGTYKFVWTIKNFTCPGTKDTITVINTEPISNNTINPLADTVCKGTPVSFTGSVPVGGGYLPNTTTSNMVYVWERSLDSVNWVTVGTNQYSYLFPGDSTSWIRRKLTSDSCVSISNITKVVVHTPILNNTIATPNPVCTGTNSSLITGSIPTGATGTYSYTWDTASVANAAAGLWSNVVVNTPDYNPNVTLTQSLVVRRNVNSGKCSSVSNSVTYVVYPDAKANFTASKTTACPNPAFQLGNFITNNVLPNTTYDWFVTDRFGVRTPLGTSNAFPGYAMSTGPDTVTITLVANSTTNPICKSDSMSMVFYTLAAPQANFTVSTKLGCSFESGTNATNFVFTNNTPFKSLFTYVWNLNAVGPGNTNSTLQDLSAGGYNFAESSTGLDTNYIITQTATSTQCGSSTWRDTIKIRTKPHVRFSAAPTFQCSDSLIKFTNTTVGSNLTYAWYFGDNGNTVGSTNSDTVSHAYHVTNLTTFYPLIKASNECSSDSSQIPVVVTSNTGTITLNMSVKGAPYQCAPATYTFYTNSTGATTYIWNFGDGSFSVPSTNGKDSVVHVYTTPGTYYVTLTGTTACGSVSKMDSVFVFGTPKVKFSLAPSTTVCKGDTVRFANLTDTATFYNWKFGDGLTSGAVNPNKVYSASGNYDVKLIATRQHNLPLGGTLTCIDSSAIQTITIRDTMPGSFAIAQIGTGCLPYNVQLINTTTISTKPYLTTWTYNPFVPTQTGDTVNQSFTQLNTYTITMTAVNAAGCYYIDSIRKTVSGPLGSWNHDTGYVCFADSVKFNVYGNTETYKVFVDYGDGDTITMLYTGSNVFKHSYKSGGTYQPKAILISANGCTYPLNAIGSIRVDYVKAAYTYTLTNNCGNTVVLFKNNSTMDQTPAAQTTNWWIDGNLGHTRDTSVTFYATNTHTVKLQTVSISGCQDSVATTVIDVKVNNIPQILNVTRQDTACANQTIYYTANVAPSEDPIQTYTWGFANGTQFISNSNTANTVYGVAGNGYFDTVTVATSYCPAKLVLPRLVIDSVPNVSINPSRDTTICFGTSITFTATGAGTNNYVWGPNFGLNTTKGATVTATPTDTVKYFVTGTNIYGCSDSASVSVGVVQPYTVTIKASKDSICKGETVELKAITNSVLQPTFMWTPSTGLDTTKGNIVHATPAATNTYTVYATNSAGCFVGTQIIDSIQIAVGDTLRVTFGADTVRLQGGVQYHLNPFYSDATASTIWTPANNLDNPFLANPTATILDNVCYQVAATSIYGCKDTAQICIQAFCEASQVFIPNSFTPDGNGMNDYFYVTATGIQKVTSFRVFNRWGQVVFERAGFIPPPYKSATFNPALAWDGKFKGVLAPTDAYVYTCEVMCANGTKYTYTGTVTLIK